MNATVETIDRAAQRRFVMAAVFVVSFGAGLRALYVAAAQADPPIYGDGVQYKVYAWNLLHHGVFSCSLPGSVSVVVDGYRGPGYPLFLAAALSLAGGDVGIGIRYAQIGQVMLGTSTVLLTIALARLWMGRGFAILAGLLVACWPHLISFCSAIISETVFGFLLALGIWLLVLGVRRSAVGFVGVLKRMRQQPLTYLSWCLLDKPWRLWAWPIVIGTGDIYYPPTRHSPFDRILMLKWMKLVIEWMNPAIYALAMLTAACVFLRVRVQVEAAFPAFVLGLFVIYITAVHMVFQAEPRYSIPYRPFEIRLALTGAAAFVQRFQMRDQVGLPKHYRQAADR